MEKKQRILLLITGITIITGITMAVFITVIYYPFALTNGDGVDKPRPPVLGEISPDPDTDGIINLLWGAVANTDYYQIYRNKDGSAFFPIGDFAHYSTSYTDSGLSNGIYGYKIKAVKDFDKSDYSNTRYVTVIYTPPDYTREAYLFPVSADDNGDVLLQWTIVSTTTHTDIIKRMKDGESYKEVGRITQTSGGDTWIDTIIEYGSYTYKIDSMYSRIIDWDHYYSNEQWILFEGLVPDATVVKDIIPAIDTDGSVTIEWEVVENVVEYELYRSSDDVNYSKIITIFSIFYRDSGLSDGTYYYKVKCIGADYDSEFSNVKSVIVQVSVPDPIIPSETILDSIVPTIDPDGDVEISWLSISDADEYKLYRSSDDVSYTKIITIFSPLISHIDRGLTDGTYYYKVICVGIDGNSDFSDVESVTVEIYIPPIPVLPTNPSIEINNGDLTTDSLDVIITLSCDDANEMRFQISSGVYLNWVTYSTSYTLTLSEINPDYPNYYIGVTFRNNDGNSGEVFDGIKYEVLNDGNGEDDEEPIITPEQIGIIIAVIIIVIPVVVIRALTKKKKIKSK